MNVRIIDANIENLSPEQVAKFTTVIDPTFAFKRFHKNPLYCIKKMMNILQKV